MNCKICNCKVSSPSVPSVEEIQRVIKEKFGELASDLPTRAASFAIHRLLTNGKEL